MALHDEEQEEEVEGTEAEEVDEDNGNRPLQDAAGYNEGQQNLPVVILS